MYVQTAVKSNTIPPESDDSEPATWAGPMFIDAHAHLYDCYDRVSFFDASLDTVRRARALHHPDNARAHTPACLMLAEPEGLHAFDAILEQGELDGGRWRFVPREDGVSLVAQCEGRDELLLIEGRQIQGADGLEILSLASDHLIEDFKYTTEQVLERIIEADGLPVVPIGVGKWLGARGRIVDRLLQGPLAGKICLGDNAGRLAMGPTPRHFLEAHKRGVWVLPGSGALPFASQSTRIGRYGLILDRPIDQQAPAASLRRAILAGGEQPEVYGQPDGPANFLKLQVGWQWRKRFSSNQYGRESDGPAL